MTKQTIPESSESLESKSRQTRFGYKLFDYIMVIFMIIAFYSVAVFVASLTGSPEELEESMLHGMRAAKDVVIALAFLAIRNLFKTVTSVLDELKATV